jgi:fatty acid desaturase
MMNRETSNPRRNEKGLLKNIIVEAIGGMNAIKRYKKVSRFRNWLPLLHIWPSIILTFIASSKLAEAPFSTYSISLLVVCSFFIASRINALSVFVHEGSHYLVYPDQRSNDFITNAFSALWILNDVNSYRIVHFKHHVHLLEKGDPDLFLYADNSSKLKLILNFIQDLTFATAIKRIAIYISVSANNNKRNYDSQNLFLSFLKIILQAFIFATFFKLTNYDFKLSLLLYCSMWVIPLFAIFPAITRIKTISEHLPDNKKPNFSVEPSFVARSTFYSKSSVFQFLQTYFIGCGMDYHFEHHIFPDIPCYNLRILHMRLLNKSTVFLGKESRDHTNTCYIGFLASQFFGKNLIKEAK